MEANKLKLNSRSIRQEITKIERLSLKDTNEKCIERVIFEMAKGYHLSIPCFNAPFNVYRARICEKPSLLSELSYPPSEYVREHGRGNFPAQSVFYCSTHAFVPFYEINCKMGDRIALSKWRTKCDMTLSHIGFTEELQQQFGSKRNLSDIYHFVTNTTNYGELNTMLYEYFGFLFSRSIDHDISKYEYKLTSTIANWLLKSERIDGLIYPSTRMFANADNIMLKKDFADSRLDFVNVQYVEIKSDSNDRFELALLDSATQKNVSDSNINWSGRPLHWRVCQEKTILIKYSNSGEHTDGAWAAYDECGKFIDLI